jgi:metallophosphoesterase superfamily enzyme
MTLFNGLVGIDSYLALIVASTSLSSERAVLIHQFDDGHGIVQPAFQPRVRGTEVHERQVQPEGAETKVRKISCTTDARQEYDTAG